MKSGDCFVSSARPFPTGGFPPKLQQDSTALKNALKCNFSAGMFANVHFFSYLCRLFGADYRKNNALGIAPSCIV